MKKRKLPPHIVLPDGRWRFIKKGRKTTRPKKTKKVKTMERRRGGFRRAGRRFAGTSGGMKGMLAPVAGGAGDVIAQRFIPINGVGSIAAGMLLKDQVTMKIGLNKAGESLGAMVAGGILGGGAGNAGVML